METFSSEPVFQDIFEINMENESKNVEMGETESDNQHDTTDDALETILMEEESVIQQKASSVHQTPTTIAIPLQPDMNLSQNKVVIASQHVQVVPQDKSGGVFTKYVLKKGIPSVTPSQSNTFTIASTGQNKSQTFTIPRNNLTLSPIKGGFKIPISPLKNPLKVSVLPNSNANTVRTVNLNSTLQSNQSQSTSNFQFQTLISPQNNRINVMPNRPIIPQNLTLQPQSSRVQCVRLVPATSVQTSATTGIPVTNLAGAHSSSSAQPVATAVVQQPKIQPYISVQTIQKPVQPPAVKPQRLIMPAKTVQQNQNSIPNISPGSLLQAGNVGYAMVPAKYVEQLKKQLNSQILINTEASSSVVPVEQNRTIQTITKAPVNGKMRKSCNCNKSMCLKLYCECFANGHFCENCNCLNCHNNLEFESDRSKAIKACLDRNPSAFRPKIGRGCDDNRTHQKGCNCKRSGCLKNYCECYEARIPCTSKCKCIGCKNVEEDSAIKNEQRSLMNLADAAAVRCQQQAAARTKINSRLGDMQLLRPKTQTNPSSGEKLPCTFFTQEVIEATCTCMLAQAEEAEKTNRSVQVAEMMILEEFGRCLMQIIQAAGKAKSSSHQ